MCIQRDELAGARPELAEGPHYLVDSQSDNAGGLGEGSLLWFHNCTGATVKIHASTFNGSSTVPSSKVSCDNGSSPQLVYLTTDPRTTGEMHLAHDRHRKRLCDPCQLGLVPGSADQLGSAPSSFEGPQFAPLIALKRRPRVPL